MKKIVIFSGTTPGRLLSEILSDSGINNTVSVATDYGETVMEPHPGVTINKGRLSGRELLDFLKAGEYDIIIDATHPYALDITKELVSCVEELNREGAATTYLRLAGDYMDEAETHTDIKTEININPCRKMQDQNPEHNTDNRTVLYCTDIKDCIEKLADIQGNILLTTGSKELSKFCRSQELKKRLIVRVLPMQDSLLMCEKNQILPKQIIAMQGPFSTEINIAIIRQYKIGCMVTKNTGAAGGFVQKKEAARQAGIPLFVVLNENRQDSDPAFVYSLAKICSELEKLTGEKICINRQAELLISLVGTGMGSHSGMTVEAKQAVERADLILGAARLIKEYIPGLEKHEAYLPGEILEWLIKKSEKYAVYKSLNVAILFSGDSGFYSGCTKVRETLLSAVKNDTIRGQIKTLPGISSVQAMAAACGTSWQDAGIYSIHGKDVSDTVKEELLKLISEHRSLFLLVSGAADIRMLGELLSFENIQGQNYCLSREYNSDTPEPDTHGTGIKRSDLEIYVGFELSYPNEEIRLLTPRECTKIEKEGLYCVLIRHKSSKGGKNRDVLTPRICDSDFIRGNVPMTKEEIRQICICKLHLNNDSVLYDIGSGTGSVSVEAAGLSESITVYAIEYKDEALFLQEKNKDKFHANNMTIIKGTAPEVFTGLKTPTHAFIGGTGGKMVQILKELYKINPKLRIVINAVSLETVAEIGNIKNDFPVRDFQTVQVQVSRYQKLGNYQMPKTENPVYICEFNFDGQEKSN